MCNICNGNGMVMDGGYFAAYIPCSNQSCLKQSQERADAQLDDLNARFGITADDMRRSHERGKDNGMGSKTSWS